jgi:L-ascorbate metabolism protein UlaG (beta-lactamase superfamily)
MLAGLGAGIGGATWWVSNSKRRGARLARALIADARRPVLPAPVTPEPSKWSDHDLTLCWLGHSTVLINFFGVNILTDPALGRRVGISLGLGTVGPKRYVSPALAVEQLPRIDLVLLSHAHMDHMDLPTLSALGQTTFVTAGLTRDILAGGGARKITELGWAECAKLNFPSGQIEISALEVKHWGQRWPRDVERGYNGYALKREGKSILFGGDTAHTELFKAHRSQGPFEAAIMPIGAYDPWIRNHCSPEEAVEMANWAGARRIIPVHHQTFKLSNEPMGQPIERMQAALASEPERLALRRVGESFVCPRA